ncbi:MAG: aldo/keto reductase [Firmicutes bacterium]|nr:aldo/keto reductase [Bacillota bacterium]
MIYRHLGHSGLKVPPYCLGTMTFGEAGWGTDEATARRMIDQALDAGINFFDTADLYSNGRAEEILGQTLDGRRSRVFIATKVRGSIDPSWNEMGLTKQRIFAAAEASLRRLRTDYVDLYQVHRWDRETPIEETLEALDRLVESGKVRYIGLSNYAAWQIVQAQHKSRENGWTPFISAQMHYSLVNRDIEAEVIPACQAEGIGILVWSPLSGGFLSGKYKNREEAEKGTRFGDRGNFWFPYFDQNRGFSVLEPLHQVAEVHHTSMASVALAWVRERAGVTAVILGARKPEQLEDNLRSLELQLSNDEIEMLEEVSRPPKSYPSWMIERQSAPSRS